MSSSSASDSPSYKELCMLLTHSTYNPAILPNLESYVRAEASYSVPYYLNANRTLLKMYQFFPNLATMGRHHHHHQDELTSLVLFLALTEFPSTDLVSLSCLIPEKVQSREPCGTIVRCSELLESCHFAEFWPLFRQIGTDSPPSSSSSSLLKTASSDPRAGIKLRRSILRILALTYRTAPTATAVLPALDLTAVSDLKEFAETDEVARGLVAHVDEDTVTFVPTPDNTKRSRVFKEGVNFDAISSMVGKTVIAKE